MSCMKCLSKCPYSKKPVLHRKILGCAPITLPKLFILTFILVSGFLEIYPFTEKSIHDNISLVFWKPRIFCLVLFWMGYNIVCTYKYMHLKLWFVIFWRRYISFLFINIGIIIFVSVILKKIKIIFIPIYLRCCKIPKGYSSNSSNISDNVNIVEITSTQHYTRIA